ncbi:hypothetical protein L1887_10119 [Cichorium endivia]|nr:hypothetical protein L1887_10119 [Cichorium endivia]
MAIGLEEVVGKWRVMRLFFKIDGPPVNPILAYLRLQGLRQSVVLEDSFNCSSIFALRCEFLDGKDSLGKSLGCDFFNKPEDDSRFEVRLLDSGNLASQFIEGRWVERCTR